MLRARNRVTCNPATTGVSLTVTHGLGTTVDACWLVACSDRGLGRTYLVNRTGANTVRVCNSVGTTVTVDVFSWVYQGRLY